MAPIYIYFYCQISLWCKSRDIETIIGTFRYLWGVGTRPGVDDIVKFKNLTQYDKSDCAAATLVHNKTYYSTVFAYNNALNSKAANASSDGGKYVGRSENIRTDHAAIFPCAPTTNIKHEPTFYRL